MTPSKEKKPKKMEKRLSLLAADSTLIYETLREKHSNSSFWAKLNWQFEKSSLQRPYYNPTYEIDRELLNKTNL